MNNKLIRYTGDFFECASKKEILILENAVSAVSRLIYEHVIIVDLIDDKVKYVTTSSLLYYKNENIPYEGDSFSKILSQQTEIDKENILNYFNIINQYFKNIDEDSYTDTTIMLELPFKIYGMSNVVSIKMSPLIGAPNNIPRYYAVCYSVSTGKTLHEITIFNHRTGNRTRYNNVTKKWNPYEKPRLSEVEHCVLVMSARGYAQKEIAEKLNMSNDTVKSIRKRLFDKLQSDNITEALMAAITRGII